MGTASLKDSKKPGLVVGDVCGGGAEERQGTRLHRADVTEKWKTLKACRGEWPR